MRKAKEALRTCLLRQKTVYHGILGIDSDTLVAKIIPRVEKYRPDTLDDVSGHQDILATINKFVESNVYLPYASVTPTQLTKRNSDCLISSSMGLLVPVSSLFLD